MSTANAIEWQLQKAVTLRFLPYTGPDYGSFLPRILIIGEANHGPAEADEDRNLTRNVVRKALLDSAQDVKDNHWVRYVRNTEAMLTGKEYGVSENIWEQLAYAVFFQHVETSPRHNAKDASPEAVRQGRAAFFTLLDILDPTYVIVWGAALLKNGWLPKDENTVTLEASIPVYAYRSHPHSYIWHCHHPSRDFSYRTEHQRWLTVQKIKRM